MPNRKSHLNLKPYCSSLAVVLAWVCAAPVWSATATVAVTVDARLIAETAPGSHFFGVQDVPPFSVMPGFSLAVGDTLDYTVAFTAGQALTISHPGLLWGYVYASAGDSQDTLGRGTLSLLDSTGAVIDTSSVKTDTEGVAHFGQNFSASDFAGLPSTITIGGLHYLGQVLGYTPSTPGVDPVVTTRDYNSPAFYFAADGFSVSAVPETRSWALMLMGLGAVALRSRPCRQR